MKRSDYTHNGSFFKSFGLLLKCVFATIGYGFLWFGIILRQASWGVPVMIAGIVMCLVAVFWFIVIPISRMK